MSTGQHAAKLDTVTCHRPAGAVILNAQEADSIMGGVAVPVESGGPA
jgi:hypothetical protein